MKEFEILNKLVFSNNDEKVTVGYTISLGGNYTCAVTEEKAKELRVADIEVVKYMSFDELEVVPIVGNKYALVENNSGFFEDYRENAKDYFGDKILYYGYYFKPQYIISLNNESALKRIVLESKNIYQD
jgi:hypothetical protein